MVSTIDSSDSSDNEFPGLDYVDQRDKEVETHIGSVSFKGLKEPVFLSQDLSGGCGGKIWECASLMIDYFVYKSEQGEALLDQKTVIELGAGTGLVGLAVAKLCPTMKQLTLTDQM